MTEPAVWLIVILAGVVALGVVEVVRSGKLAGGRWQEVRVMAMGAAVILVTTVAAVLAITWVVVIVLFEIWQPFLIGAGALVGSGVMIAMYLHQRNYFYVSAVALAVALILLVL